MPDTWQDALWFLPNYLAPWWDMALALLALLTALVVLTKMILRHPVNLLFVSRAIWCSGFVAVGLIPLNSGWTKHAIAAFTVGGALTAIAITTDWCERPGTAWQKISYFRVLFHLGRKGRADRVLKGIVGKRLTYRSPDSAET